MILRCLVLVLSLPLLFGCALPRPERGQQTFIADRELAGVSLAREGLSYFRKSRFVDAESRFRQSLFLYPDVDNIQLNLAITLEQLGQDAEAERIFLELLSRHPSSIDHLAAYGHFLSSAERFAEAVQRYEEALELAFGTAQFPKAAQVARSLSALAFLLGQEESGLCYSELAYQLTASGEELIRHAKLLTATGRFVQGREFLQKHAKNIEGDPRLANRMALVQYGLGETEEAAKYNSIALDVGLDDPQEKFESAALGVVLAKPEDEEPSEAQQETYKMVIKMSEGPSALYLPAELLIALEQVHGTRTEG